jgi:hypothetical protein
VVLGVPESEEARRRTRALLGAGVTLLELGADAVVLRDREGWRTVSGEVTAWLDGHAVAQF